MVNENDITNFNRTDAELEEFWLFALVVAGKNANTQARLLDGFLIPMTTTPFAYIEKLLDDNDLLEMIKLARLGQYTKLEKAFTQSIDLDLRNATIEELEAVHGVGPKTARFFLMHSRPNQRLAALDTHILKHLAANGVENVPKMTPSKGPRYRELEQEFLTLADQSGMSPAEYDLIVWKKYAGRT